HHGAVPLRRHADQRAASARREDDDELHPRRHRRRRRDLRPLLRGRPHRRVSRRSAERSEETDDGARASPHAASDRSQQTRTQVARERQPQRGSHRHGALSRLPRALRSRVAVSPRRDDRRDRDRHRRRDHPPQHDHRADVDRADAQRRQHQPRRFLPSPRRPAGAGLHHLRHHRRRGRSRGRTRDHDPVVPAPLHRECRRGENAAWVTVSQLRSLAVAQQTRRSRAAQRRDRATEQPRSAMSSALLLVVLLPAIGALINGTRAVLAPHTPKNKTTTNFFALATTALSALIATWIVIQSAGSPWQHVYFQWIPTGLGHAGALLANFTVDFALRIDHLSSTMLMIVTWVGFLIHVYATGYMSHEKGYTRFFPYLNLFMFMMLLLVLGANYIVMFVGWEGVGLCSY